MKNWTAKSANCSKLAQKQDKSRHILVRTLNQRRWKMQLNFEHTYQGFMCKIFFFQKKKLIKFFGILSFKRIPQSGCGSRKQRNENVSEMRYRCSGKPQSEGENKIKHIIFSGSLSFKRIPQSWCGSRKPKIQNVKESRYRSSCKPQRGFERKQNIIFSGVSGSNGSPKVDVVAVSKRMRMCQRSDIAVQVNLKVDIKEKKTDKILREFELQTDLPILMW